MCAVSVHAEEAIWRNHMAIAAEAAKRGDHAAALQMYSAAAKQAQAFGDNDVRLASALFSLAQAYRAQYDYAPAEKNYLRALAILESQPPSRQGSGLLHERNASVLNGLADLCRLQGRYREAEDYYKRELAFLEKTQGLGGSSGGAGAVEQSGCVVSRTRAPR